MAAVAEVQRAGKLRFDRNAWEVAVNDRALAPNTDATWEALAPIDVREVLPAISAPTLVLHRIGDAIPIEGARYIAERIPAAQLVELAGADHWWWVGDYEPVLNAIGEATLSLAKADQGY